MSSLDVQLALGVLSVVFLLTAINILSELATTDRRLVHHTVLTILAVGLVTVMGVGLIFVKPSMQNKMLCFSVETSKR